MRGSRKVAVSRSLLVLLRTKCSVTPKLSAVHTTTLRPSRKLPPRGNCPAGRSGSATQPRQPRRAVAAETAFATSTSSRSSHKDSNSDDLHRGGDGAAGARGPHRTAPSQPAPPSSSPAPPASASPSQPSPATSTNPPRTTRRDKSNFLPLARHRSNTSRAPTVRSECGREQQPSANAAIPTTAGRQRCCQIGAPSANAAAAASVPLSPIPPVEAPSFRAGRKPAARAADRNVATLCKSCVTVS
jgi:hypothetical protein